MGDPFSTGANMAFGAIGKKALEKSAGELVDRISFKFARDKYDVLKFVVNKGLHSYLEANYAKCETLKTLLNRNDPVAIEDSFVAPDFEIQGGVVTSEQFLVQVNKTGGKGVITGLAGSGKSVFLKYSFRNVIEKGYSYYPVFFELRSLNRRAGEKDILLSEIFASMHDCCDSFTRAQFDYGLKSGGFYFLLDGFDELNQEVRDQIAEEISFIARVYSKCALLVTSRPSDEFISWEGFSEVKLLPFNLEKSVSYIEKLRFDLEKKRAFIEDLKGGLFEKNEDFLSNPLLSAMMLLTYDSFGEIPEKRHIFYAKCFEVLAREHDASKGRYKRDLFSDLAMDQIERTFMYFCTISYVERMFSFSDDQMISFVGEAIDACGVIADTAEVIRDFRESISIMERVGLSYEFAHRSFQEYFYAKFVVTDRRASLQKKIGWLVDDFETEDTVEMIADMNRTYFEDDYLLPNVKNLYAKLESVDPDVNPAGVLSKFYTSLRTVAGLTPEGREYERVAYWHVSDNGVRFLLQQALHKYHNNYIEELGEYKADLDMDDEKTAEKIGKEFGGDIHVDFLNNEKLIEVKAHKKARYIKAALSCLLTHLEGKQAQREKGLSALIRREYLGGSRA